MCAARPTLRHSMAGGIRCWRIWTDGVRARARLLAAAALYLGGAAGVESAGQLYAAVAGKATPLYAALATIEEILEMAGVAVLVYALLEHLARIQAAECSAP